MDFWTPFELGPGEQLDMLLVLDHVTSAELEAGEWLVSEENEHVMDYLNALEDKYAWGVTSLFPVPVDKPKAAEIKQAAPRLLDTVWKVHPRLIIAMGGSALSALWPDEYGPKQSVSKAKAMDLKLGTIDLLATYAPKSHMWFLRSEGRVGMDLNQEYERTFVKASAILDGVYTPRTFTYTEINSAEDAAWLLNRKRELAIARMGFDTEDTTWWATNLQPHKFYLEGVDLPDKLTLWHPDTELSWCSITWRLPAGGYETFSLHPRIMNAEFLHALFCDCLVSAWNILYEIASAWRFCGFDMCDPRNRIRLYDGMIRYAVRDQSVTAIGLKGVCQQFIGAPAWDLPLKQALDEARAIRAKACGVSVAAIDDVPENVGRKYNAADTFYMVVLEDEYLDNNRDGGLHPECRAYDHLIQALPFFARLERTGSHVDVEMVQDIIEDGAAALEGIDRRISEHPVSQNLSTWLGTAFKPTKVLHYRALIAYTYGTLNGYEPLSPDELRMRKDQRLALMQRRRKAAAVLPKWFLRAKDGQGQGPAMSEKAIRFYSEGGAHPEHAQGWQKEVWELLLERKAVNDDLLKYYSILNYIAGDNHIHSSYRIVRSNNETDDSNSAKGTSSGRTSTTPNSQNRKPVTKPAFTAPPGFVKVVIDVKGAEMRVIGHNTRDPLFTRWALEGKDTHLELGSQLWGYATGRDPEEFFQFRSREECARLDEPAPEQKPWRKVGKTLNFAGLYKEEPESFAHKVGITPEEARERSEERREMAPGIYAAEKMIYERLEKGLPAITSMFGRIRYANGWVPTGLPADQFLSFDPEVKRKRNSANMSLFRSIWNTWGAQADANDIVIYKGVVIDHLIRTGYFDEQYLRMDNFIHDAIVFDIWESKVDEYVPVLNFIFQSNDYLPAPLTVPLGTSVETGPDMGDLKPYLKEA